MRLCRPCHYESLIVAGEVGFNSMEVEIDPVRVHAMLPKQNIDYKAHNFENSSTGIPIFFNFIIALKIGRKSRSPQNSNNDGRNRKTRNLVGGVVHVRFS